MNHIFLNLFDVDLVIITLAYLLIYFGDAKAGLFAFSLGILIDIFSAGPFGFFTMIYMTTFLGIRFGSLLFDLLSTKGQMILVILAALLKEILFLGLMALFSFDFSLTFSLFFTLGGSALISGLMAPFVFAFFNRLNHAFTEGIWGGSEKKR